MRIGLYVTEAGLVLADDEGNIIQAIKYEDDAYQKFRLVSTGNRIGELDDILRKAAELKIDEITTHVPGIDTIAESMGIRADVIEGPSTDERMELMVKTGFVMDERGAVELIREFAIKTSEEKIREAAARLDLHIIQIISAIDELDRVVNLLAARVREWYGLHFPELDGIVQDPRIYVRVVSVLGRRENLTTDNLMKLSVPQERAEAIDEARKNSKGADIREEELSLLQASATQAYNSYQLRLRLTSQLEELMNRVAPNITNLVGATIGARLIAKAGGLDGLTRLPASTIQVLGAEKALFRALRKGGKPPKHGIIFQHPIIHGSPRWQRGKIARTLAAKLAIASRLDYYSGVLDPSFAEKMEKRIKEIKEKYAEPPIKPKKKPKARRKGRRHGKGKT